MMLKCFGGYFLRVFSEQPIAEATDATPLENIAELANVIFALTLNSGVF
jgi:hypothetical protein